jgi:hypothetical protein
MTHDMTHPFEIVDVLGNRALITRRYGDGSFDCPHCGYPVVAPAVECSHPWCAAHPGMPLKEARYILEVKAAEKRAREAERRRNRTRVERIEAERAERERAWVEVKAEVARRGACYRCAVKTFSRGRVKIVTHRKRCPLERGR